MVQLGELCLLQRVIEKSIEEYMALLEKKDKMNHWICLLAFISRNSHNFRTLVSHLS